MGMVGRRRVLVAASAMLAAPFALAQARRNTVRLGFLTTSLLTLRTPMWQPFFIMMEKRGWREGIDYVLLERETRGDPGRATELAKELVSEQVDLVLAIATASALAVRKVSSRIPIVTWCGYPVEAGLATGLARPGGNVTGVANYAGTGVWGKFVELLRELRPDLRQIAVLWDYAPPAFPDGPVASSAVEEAARQIGIASRTWTVRSEKDLDEARAEIERGSFEAMILTTGGGIHNRGHVMDRISDLVLRQRLPAITDVGGSMLFTRASCVLAYSPNIPEILTRLADIADRVLRGANPAQLPFERPSKFNLTINVKVARKLGFTVPRTLLLRADRVIE